MGKVEKKEWCFFTGGLPLLLYGSFWAGKSHGANSTASKFGLPFEESVSFPYHGKGTRLSRLFYTKNDHYAKTGSGQT